VTRRAIKGWRAYAFECAYMSGTPCLEVSPALRTANHPPGSLPRVAAPADTQRASRPDASPLLPWNPHNPASNPTATTRLSKWPVSSCRTAPGPSPSARPHFTLHEPRTTHLELNVARVLHIALNVDGAVAKGRLCLLLRLLQEWQELLFLGGQAHAPWGRAR
jgi:hypothetical protein